MASFINFFFSFQLLSALFESLLHLAHVFGLSVAPSLATQNLSDMLGFLLWVPLLFLAWTRAELPLRLVLPLLVGSLWGSVGLWPWFLAEGIDPQRDRVVSFVQLGLHALALLYRRKTTAHPFGLYETGRFDGDRSLPYFKFFLGFPMSLASIFLLYVALVLGSGLDRLVQESRQHVKFEKDGIYTRYEIYRKQESEVHLIGMMHVARESFYRELLDVIPREDAVVLSEGVSDEKNLLQGGFQYKGVAARLQVADQGEVFQRQLMKSHKVIRADLDVSQLSPQTIALLQDISRLYRGETQLNEMGKLFDPKLSEAFRRDLIERRNQEALRVFDQEALKHRILVLPWGALHNADLADGLLDRSYKLEGFQYYKALDFKSLLSNFFKAKQ